MIDKEKVVSRIMEQIELDWEDEVRFLQDIGRFPSTLGNEQALQNHLAHFFESDLKMKVNRIVPDMQQLSQYRNFSIAEWSYDGREVVVATAEPEGESYGKSLIFQGHIDVVPTGPLSLWKYDPFGSVRVDNKLYGRGMLDMKSGVAAMIHAYRAIIRSGYEPAAKFSIQSVIEEETTGHGALAALANGFHADAALIPEPFGYHATTVQVGIIWFRITVRGTGAHTVRAYEGVNAIDKAYKVVKALRKYEAFINKRERPSHFIDHPHPLNLNIGTMKAGDWPSSVPQEAVIEGRVGFYPNQNASDIKKEFVEWIEAAAKEDEWLKENVPEVHFFGFNAEGSVLDENEPMLKTLAKSHEEVVGGKLEHLPLTAVTDARFFLDFDIPCTCYGPIGENMHDVNEWVDLESVKTVTKVYAMMIMNWCGLNEKS